jgi:hypothetical protein
MDGLSSISSYSPALGADRVGALRATMRTPYPFIDSRNHAAPPPGGSLRPDERRDLAGELLALGQEVLPPNTEPLLHARLNL